MKKNIVISLLMITMISATPVSYAETSLFDQPDEAVTPPAVSEQIDEDSDVINPETLDENKSPMPETPVLTEQAADTTETKSPGGSVVNQKIVKLIINSDNAFVDGQKIKLDTPAASIKGRTFLPLRFIAEKLLEVAPVYDAAAKTITIVKDGKTAILTTGKKEARIDGAVVMLDSAPIVKNGSTLLPLRFFVENFDMSISYDSAKKEVTIKKVTGINNLPVAAFEFSQENYVAGQKIEHTDKSIDPDGDAIIAYEWMASLDFNKKSADLNQLLSKAPSGDYLIKYRVQDSKKSWSEWIEKNLVIKPNEPPVVTSVNISKSSVGRGETFDITREFTNEEWEAIAKEEWTYRHVSQSPSQAKKEKPARIFTAGEYVITLSLTDTYGNRSTEIEKTITVTDRIVQTQMNYLATSDNVNSTLENYNNTDYVSVFKNIANLNFIDNQGTLIMSDSPENVQDYGILYEETTNQNGRMLLYHVNKIPSPRNSGAGIIIVVENMDTVPVNFSLEKTGMKGPSTDPLAVGTKVLEAHFSPNNQYGSYAIEPGKKTIVFDSRGTIHWKADHLVSMLSEYLTTGNVKISVVSVGPETRLEHMELLTYLPRDIHPRGTFGVTQRSLDIAIPSTEAFSVTLGSGDSEWITGIDGITNEQVVNRGNYGVEYKLNMTPEEDTLVFINARGGPFKGIVGWTDNSPRYINSYYMSTATYVGKLPKGITSTMRYMLPNGSSSPIIIGFMPEYQWAK
ncbi:MAG: stalk domain-containing protein [Proteocatella sp.]